jgi:cyanophycinase
LSLVSQSARMSEKRIIKGTLIPVGGSEDKGDHENSLTSFTQKGILSHVLRESGGTKSRIVVIPTASKIPVEVGENYVTAFSKLGCSNVDVIDIREKKQSEDKAFLKLVEQADCVMMTGGNQSRIATRIANTSLHRLMDERLHNDKIVIAGTSAGAMAMAGRMISGGSGSEALVKGAVKMRSGLGLIPELIIDTHFVRRGRFGRLAEAVAAYPHLLGVGIAEDTGLIIRNNNEFTVIGSGMVLVMDPAGLTHNSHKLLKQGTPMSMSHLTVHILANGDHFTLDNKIVEVLPIEKSFV